MEPRADLDSSKARLGYLARVLFDQAPVLLPMGQGLATRRPFLSNLGLHLPEAGRAFRGAAAARWYEAATLHAAAHLRHPARFERGSLKPVQIALIGVLEDARVERLAMAEMPGLRALWLPYHVAEPAHGDSFVVLMLRLARCLLDSRHQDPHPWVNKARALVDAGEPLRAVASRLGHDIGQMRLPFNSRDYVVEPAYRDDNGHLWLEAGDKPAQPQWQLSSDEAPSPPDRAQDASTEQGAAPDAPPIGRWQYPEWDRLVRGYRGAWCTVLESRPHPGDPTALREALERRPGLLRQLERVMRSGALREPRRLRAQLHGDTLDIDAAVSAAIARRARHSPGERIHQRVERGTRDVAALLLLDASASTADSTGQGTVLALAQQAALLTAATLQQAGDRCAIHAFASNGRHEVRYERALDFGEPLDGPALARLAGLRSRLSTRMGAALRHASALLAAEPCRKRLLLFVTDGEPHDIDIHDRRYLVEDARKAVLEAGRAGVTVFCVALDAAAGDYLRAIFGAGRYRVLDRVESLPRVLPGAVAGLVS